jgi:hypothetical protein
MKRLNVRTTERNEKIKKRKIHEKKIDIEMETDWFIQK